MEFSKDIQGNKYFSFEEDDDIYILEGNKIGNKLDDFEILQILSEKNDLDSTFVAKVRSLNNNKIYSIKKLKIDNNHRQEIFNIMNKLKNINHPHIIKYHNYFEENNNLYLIMEYMNNSDILKYIQGYQILNKHIPETEIWNILLQCLSALNYLVSLNLGNLGIKLTNIFVNNLYNIKISVFRDINLNSQYYSQNDDIYYLSKYFYIMMSLQSFTVKQLNEKMFIDNLNTNNNENENYSLDLRNFLNKMNSAKQNKITVLNLYEELKNIYEKKFTKNTSIKAILQCLSSFKGLTEVLTTNKELFEKDKKKYFMNNWYLKLMDAMKGINENNFIIFINEFRRAIASSFFKLDGNKEIDPLFVLIFLLDKLHKETNIIDRTFIIENGYSQYIKKNNSKNSLFNGEEQDKTNKIQMLSEFENYFNNTMNSPISNLFIGFIKTKRNCQNCRTGYYSFSNYLYVIFDLSELNSAQNFDLIIDGFHKNWEIPKIIDTNGPNKIWCERCQMYQTFKEFNRYYLLKNQLIIVFIRGKNYKNRSKIIFNERINLQKYVEPNINCPHNFYLVGSINRKVHNIGEEYVAYYKDPNDENRWASKGFDQIQKNDNEQIIMLFYNSKDQ